MARDYRLSKTEDCQIQDVAGSFEAPGKKGLPEMAIILTEVKTPDSNAVKPELTLNNTPLASAENNEPSV